MRKSLLLLLVVLTCTFTTAAIAQETEYFYDSGQTLATPDGIPPSGEDVCDGDTGAAYGLCVAFCEAMDCDSGNANASPTACDKVADNYERRTGSLPPCLCPCISEIPGWAAALNGELGEIVACTENVIPGFDDFVALITDTGLAPGSEAAEFLGFGFCGFAFGSGPFTTTTLEEAAQCNALVRRKAADAGVSCTP